MFPVSSLPTGHHICREAFVRFMGIGKERLSRCKRTFHGVDKRTISCPGGSLYGFLLITLFCVMMCCACHVVIIHICTYMLIDATLAIDLRTSCASCPQDCFHQLFLHAPILECSGEHDNFVPNLHFRLLNVYFILSLSPRIPLS